MIRMTEMMASNGGFMGPPGIHMRLMGGPPGHKKEEKDNTPRHEESIEDIMAKMNKLSDEIGDNHEKKYKVTETKNNRTA